MPDYLDWPENFPPVIHFVEEWDNPKPWRLLSEHPDYDAAKNHEDLDAAQRLVRDFMRTPWAEMCLQKIAPYQDAVIVPVRAFERQGKNRIPQAAAGYIGSKTGFEVDNFIVQSNIVQRTGNDAIYRLAFRPQFDGQVQSGRRYILIDDVFSNGGSFSELRQYIEQRGGKVVHTAAMTTGGHGDIIGLLPQTRLDLETKFGVELLIDFCKECNLYGGNYKAFTEPEAFYLARSPSLDAARDRIAQARRERDFRLSSEGVQGHQTHYNRTVTQDSQDKNSLHSPETPFTSNLIKDNQLSFDFDVSESSVVNAFSSANPGNIPEDFIHKTIIKNVGPPGLYSIIGKKITLAKSGSPTKKGWNELYDALSIYRSKQFETFRYLFIDKNGEIADHLAIGSRNPSQTAIFPDAFSNDYFLHLMESYAEKNDYGIIICHNHPSGAIEPSEEDKNITGLLELRMGDRFQGHIILDHGKFSFCGNNTWHEYVSDRESHDPLIQDRPETFFNMAITDPADLSLVRAALKIDGGHKWNDTGWIPVVFINGRSIITTIHYYQKSDFTRDDAPPFLIDKTVKIAQMTGSTRAFPITDEDMYDVFMNLNMKIHLFTDFYAQGKTMPVNGPDPGIYGHISNYFDTKITEIDSTFPIPQKPGYIDADFHNAAELAVSTPQNPGYRHSIHPDDLLKWAAVNTPALYKSLVTMDNNISSCPSYNKKKIANLKREKNELFGNLKHIYYHLELDGFDSAKFESSIDTIFGLTNITNLRHNLVYFGHVPEILTHTGLPNASLYMKTSHVFTSMKEYRPSKDNESDSFNYHSIPPDIIKQIHESLKKPLYILQSRHYPASLIVVLDLYDKDNNPLVVPITPFRKQSLFSCELRYNAISSVYGKSRFELFLKNHENLILYENKNGSRLFRPRERQSPRVTLDHLNSGFHDDHEKNQLLLPLRPQSSTGNTEHLGSGFYENNIQHYKNTVKDYVTKTGIMNPLFLAEPQVPYGSPKITAKESIMYDFTGNVSSLPPSRYSAIIEYLEKIGDMKNMDEIRRFHSPLVSNPEFAFINEYVPPPGDTPFDQYQAMIAQLHAKGARHFHNLYPDRPEPGHVDYSQYPIPHSEGPSASPLAFLESAQSMKKPEEYEALYNRYYQFLQGSIKDISARQIAFFQENNTIPSAILENTPENWAKFFNRANNLNIAVNNIIPHPKDVYEQGIGILNEAFTSFNNNMSREYHTHDFSRLETVAEPQAPYLRTSAPDAANVPAATVQGANFRKHQIFAQNAYVPGTEIPQFGQFAGDRFLSYEGYRFDRTENANQTIIIKKDGKEASVSSTLYNQIITNTKSFLSEKEITPEIVEKYEQDIGADHEKTRNNTAANYWHNYRVLCREQASTPVEAMEIAKSIITEMPCEEQEKFKNHIKLFEKTSKPPQSYNQRILAFYHESVKDLPVDKSIFAENSIPSINHTAEVIDNRGTAIDPRLRIKIGDSLSLNVKIDDLLTDKKKDFNAKNLILVSASNELNKVVLADKENFSKYVFAMDEFINRVEKLEKKQQKAVKKERKYESIGY
jgi:hypothetical protein